MITDYQHNHKLGTRCSSAVKKNPWTRNKPLRLYPTDVLLTVPRFDEYFNYTVCPVINNDNFNKYTHVTPVLWSQKIHISTEKVYFIKLILFSWWIYDWNPMSELGSLTCTMFLLLGPCQTLDEFYDWTLGKDPSHRSSQIKYNILHDYLLQNTGTARQTPEISYYR
jgi:hypothetical protein